MAEMERFTADQGLAKERFNTNLQKSFAELGYDPTKGTFDLGELLAQGQRATISGRAYDALRNDFAARGMLQSGAYQARRGVLDSDLMRQREALDKTGADFLVDQDAARKAREAQNEVQRRAALDEAKQAVLNRFATGG
jgi:hypothetical protein